MPPLLGLSRWLIRSQYGWVMKFSTRPETDQPATMPTRMPSEALNSRLRSSRRCSSRVIEPSAARWNWVPRRRRGSIFTGGAALLVADALDRVGDLRRRGHLSLQRLAPGLRLRLAVHVVLGQALGLGLQDPHRTAERPGGVG